MNFKQLTDICKSCKGKRSCFVICILAAVLSYFGVLGCSTISNWFKADADVHVRTGPTDPALNDPAPFPLHRTEPENDDSPSSSSPEPK